MSKESVRAEQTRAEVLLRSLDMAENDTKGA